MTHTHTHTHTQPFYGSVEFVRDNPVIKYLRNIQL